MKYLQTSDSESEKLTEVTDKKLSLDFVGIIRFTTAQICQYKANLNLVVVLKNWISIHSRYTHHLIVVQWVTKLSLDHPVTDWIMM